MDLVFGSGLYAPKGSQKIETELQIMLAWISIKARADKTFSEKFAFDHQTDVCFTSDGND